jgi:hypothetical protein
MSYLVPSTYEIPLWEVHLGIPRAGSGFGIDLKKPDLKYIGLSLAQPDLPAYKLGPNPAQIAKSLAQPDNPGPN